MPLATCPKCGHQQIVPRDFEGLSTRCGACAAEFRVAGDGEHRPRKRSDLFPAEAKYAAWIVLGILALGTVVGVTVVLARAKSQQAAGTAPPTEPTTTRTPRTMIETRHRTDDPLADEERENRAQKVADALRGKAFSFGMLIGGMVVLLYGMVLLGAGAWVARDAGRRGSSSLGWAFYYYAMQATSRVICGPFLWMPLVAFTFLGVGSPAMIDFVGVLFIAWVLAVEFAAWFISLGVYLVSRRPGGFKRCGSCGCSRLAYLSPCPMCGVPESQG